MKKTTAFRLSVRDGAGNPDHHLYNNNGVWWLHYTIHLPGYTGERIRESLRTRNGREARVRRDRRLAELSLASAKGALEPESAR